MTGLEILGILGAPASIALAGAVVYLVIRGQAQTAKLEGALIMANTERMQAERSAMTEATRSATYRLEAGQLRVALERANEELARERGVPALIRSQLASALEELDACDDPAAVRSQLRRMLSDGRDPS